MFSIGKIKPERRIVGSINANIDSIMATCCVLDMVEIRMPNDSDMMINNSDSPSNKNRLPCTGMPKTVKPNTNTINAIMNEIKT